MSNTTAAEVRKHVEEFEWNNYPEWDHVDSDWLRMTLLDLLDRLEAAEERVEHYDKKLTKAEATIKRQQEAIEAVESVVNEMFSRTSHTIDCMSVIELLNEALTKAEDPAK